MGLFFDFTCFRILNAIFFLLSQFDNGGEIAFRIRGQLEKGSVKLNVARVGFWKSYFESVLCDFRLAEGRTGSHEVLCFTFYTKHKTHLFFLFLLLHISIY